MLNVIRISIHINSRYSKYEPSYRYTSVRLIRRPAAWVPEPIIYFYPWSLDGAVYHLLGIPDGFQKPQGMNKFLLEGFSDSMVTPYLHYVGSLFDSRLL